MPLIETIAHDRIRELRLARPPVNALDPVLCDELVLAIETAVADGADGLVLSGGPKVFSAGLDVPYLLSVQDDRRVLRAAWDSFFNAAYALAACPVPVIAAIAGHAPAGGCVLALCCDARIMAAGPYSIGLNETQVGLRMPVGVLRLMQRTVGQRQAERLVVPGLMLDAEQALAIGLVDEVVGVAEVVTRAVTRLQALAALPRTPMLATRALTRADLVEAMSPAALELDAMIDAWFDPDPQAALHALVARLGKR